MSTTRRQFLTSATAASLAATPARTLLGALAMQPDATTAPDAPTTRAAPTHVPPMRATRLRTEYLTQPLGIDRATPRLFWWPTDARDGARQTAYRVRCASDAARLAANAPDLWDSGRVASDACAHVAYAGKPLGSRARVAWDVTLWDADGVEHAPTEVATFELGLLARGDWLGQWVGTPIRGTAHLTPAVPWVRRAFRVDQPVRRARLYITALGLHEAHLNGQRVSDDYFRPGWTDYHDRVQYQTYDVTRLIVPGENVVGALLGDGWYAGRVSWHDRGEDWGDAPALLAQLELEHDDGSVTRVVTDERWQWRRSPILSSDFMEGEEYDARLEDPSWCRPTAAAPDATTRPARPADSPAQRPTMAREAWQPVIAVAVKPELAIVAQPNEPVRITQELRPVADPVRKGSARRHAAFIYDLGQNFAGVARLRIKGPAGVTVRLRFAEMLRDDGTLYTDNLREARVQDYYTLRGDPGGETYTPTFTFHGFRYVEVGVPERALDGRSGPTVEVPGRDAVVGLVMHSDTPATGSFACSDERLNQLQRNITWGQRSNFLEVPTDCPQRDERLGWTGDAQVFAPTAAFNMDVAGFFTKWSRDCDDAQRPDGGVTCVVPSTREFDGWGDGAAGWSDARVICPWAMYQAYADRDLLARHYGSMVRWIEFQAATARDGGLRGYEGFSQHRGFGDWLALDRADDSHFGGTPLEFCGTAYYARSAGLMADVARVLERADDAARFDQLRADAVAAFNRAFVRDGALTVGTQTAQLMALGFDLLPEPQRPAAVERLVALIEARDGHLSTGFLGTPLLLPVLARFGRLDVAWRVLMQTSYPGWLFTVSLGATTMWERWNSWTPDKGFGNAGMNSFNHYAYGAVGRWMYDTVGGLALDPARPGYAHVIVAPRPGGGVTHAAAALDSIRGRIETAWRIEGDRFALDALLPPSVTATVSLPDGSSREVGAGHHRFECAAATK